LKEVNCLSFKPVAVIAAIDIEGKIVSYLLRDFSIKTEDVIEFLGETSY
jgi:hypothetical protein